QKYTRLQDPKLIQELYADGVKFLERVPRMDVEALTPIVEFMGKKPIPVEVIADNSIVNRLERDGFIAKLYGKHYPTSKTWTKKSQRSTQSRCAFRWTSGLRHPCLKVC